jgi:TetR/AcrR family transcriptional repressor of nem operon
LVREREFDEDDVLERAMMRFWRVGYSATSVRDLGEAMGLGTASLYNAFGDKQTLFSRCLDRYLDTSMRARIARLEKECAPRRAIETFIGEVVERSLKDRLGCMLVNTAVEVAPRDSGVAQLVSERMAEIEGFFRRCILAGQRDGSIAIEWDPSDLACLLLTTVVGLRVLARGYPKRSLLQGAARQATTLLNPSTLKGRA